MAITFTASVKVIGTGASAAVNMTGASLFVAILGGLASLPAGGPSADTGSNTWTALTLRAGTSGGELRMYYVINPTVSASHTFTNGNSTFGSMIVLGFANTGAFDQESGAAAAATQPGTITPAVANSLFVTGFGGGNAVVHSVNAPFTFDKENDFGSGVNYDSASAYLIDTTLLGRNPTWSKLSGSGAAAMAVFSPAATSTVKQLAALGVG